MYFSFLVFSTLFRRKHFMTLLLDFGLPSLRAHLLLGCQWKENWQQQFLISHEVFSVFSCFYVCLFLFLLLNFLTWRSDFYYFFFFLRFFLLLWQMSNTFIHSFIHPFVCLFATDAPTAWRSSASAFAPTRPFPISSPTNISKYFYKFLLHFLPFPKHHQNLLIAQYDVLTSHSKRKNKKHLKSAWRWERCFSCTRPQHKEPIKAADKNNNKKMTIRKFGRKWTGIFLLSLRFLAKAKEEHRKSINYLFVECGVPNCSFIYFFLFICRLFAKFVCLFIWCLCFSFLAA